MRAGLEQEAKPVGDRIHAFTYLELCASSGTLRQDYAAVEATDIALRWRDRGGTILVGFRPGGTVTFKRYDPANNELPVDKIRRWLGAVKQGW
jgi:hypothetical protein